MGAAHSRAWATVAQAFDVPLRPRMAALAGRDGAATRAAAHRFGDPEGVRQRAAAEMADTARAAAAFGVDTVVGFTGSSIWHTVAMFPPTPDSMIEAGYADFARRWNPILDVFDAEGVRFAHEVHPTEIAYDFWTAARTLEAVDHRAAFDARDRRRAAGLAPPARVVLVAGQFAMPGQQRRRRHGKDSGPRPARYEPCQSGEPHPVGGLVTHPADVAAQHRVLVPEHEQLSILRQVPAEHEDSEAEYPAN